MPLDINQVFAPHERVLTAASQRMELLAANMANADTPNLQGARHRFQGRAAGRRAINPR